MTDTSPDALGTVVGQLVEQLAAMGQQEGGALRRLLDGAEQRAGRAAGEVAELPDEVWQQVKELVDPPDWWSLLVYALVRIGESEPGFTVGTLHLDGWSRMLTLTYAPEGRPGPFTLGLAVTDEGTKGVLLRAADGFRRVFAGQPGLRIEVAAEGDCDWRYPFGGTVHSPTPRSELRVAVDWQPPVAPQETTGFRFELGPLHLRAELSRGGTAPLYRLVLGLGTPAAETAAGTAGPPGVRAVLDPAAALGALGAFVRVAPVTEVYSPHVVVTEGQSPRYGLT
ncbi:hypothetical protein [Kitasatospora phosalacinea]|uniref:Uncharacterized protein n=1 Tax=Kitasatospora phosalacinea TaxID=2065 RepID=A0ABW6GII8_9ACTN